MTTDVNARVKELRLKFCMTQKEFGEKLGLSRDAIAAYERGTVKPPKVAMCCICAVFNVNPAWLENGEGNMFVYSGTSSRDFYLLQEIKNSDLLYSLVEMWISAPPAEHEIISVFFDSVASHCNAMRTAKVQMQQEDLASKNIVQHRSTEGLNATD